MKVIVSCVAIGGWYPRGAERLRESLKKYAPGVELQAWIDEYPPGAPGAHFVNGWDYGPYMAKPFAVLHALRTQDCDIVIQIDAAFYATRDIQPLVDYIAKNGYYACNNGAIMGEWTSDAALHKMNITRETSFVIPEITTYAIGLNRRNAKSIMFARLWADAARNYGAFAGPHTAGSPFAEGVRNSGFVSNDSRVKGFRHDQTWASYFMWKLGMDGINRPLFTAYKAGFGDLPNETTVFENEGM